MSHLLSNDVYYQEFLAVAGNDPVQRITEHHGIDFQNGTDFCQVGTIYVNIVLLRGDLDFNYLFLCSCECDHGYFCFLTHFVRKGFLVIPVGIPVCLATICPSVLLSANLYL